MENIFDPNVSMIRIVSLLNYKLGVSENQTRCIIRKYGGFKNQNSNLKKIEENFPAFLNFITQKYKVKFTRHRVNRKERLRPYQDETEDEWSDYAHTSEDL